MLTFASCVACRLRTLIVPLQEDVLSKAEFCATQARLVALQLSVLQQKKQVINLSARAVLQFMEEQQFAEVCVFR